ncbi:hypothetical protein HPB51_018628 [Rhipicephalus microplus]|uniref:Uncharacterized protein n=1 Tax=Rhipicephalus microplus TaxID=6941 RepID=A0A9J6F4Y0_RHIMP|nr:hypothetical protein HPB51_018628 [Rhipicephalus microplus]
MASVSGSVAADEKHSLPSRSTDHMGDTQTSQDADMHSSSEHNAHPCITITKRANKRRQLQPHTVPTQQLPSTPSEPALHQSRPKTRLPRHPPLPADDYKLAIRSHGRLNLSKVSPKTSLLAIAHAANIRSEKPDIKLRVDENQNVLTISTSSEHITTALGQITKITVHAATYDITSYGIAPDNSCENVVNGIGYEITPDDFLTELEVPGYEVLTCRLLGDSGAMVLTFCGKRLHSSSTCMDRLFAATSTNELFPTAESATKQDTARMCAHSPLTHRNVQCWGFSITKQPRVPPSFVLCGGDHPTAAKPRPKRFLLPVNRRKPPRSATTTRKAQSPSPSPGRQSSASGSTARGTSRSGDKSGPKRGNSSSRSGFAGQQGSQGWHMNGTTHHHGQQSCSHKKAQTGYATETPKGRRLTQVLAIHRMTLLTEPDQPTRLGNSVSRDTCPDLTIVTIVTIPGAKSCCPESLTGWTPLEELSNPDDASTEPLNYNAMLEYYRQSR